ncbi:MAG TPA: pantoate--beta-alanine ligase [Bacteroidetes bacterium]|nr:pantoate--beta-alanine ligase [Bacteroidota bacterium]
MILFKQVEELRSHLEKERAKGSKIGFVPTMGALHKGHLSLIDRSVADTDITVCSIFVNPTQFNESADLKKYPRTPGKDISLLCEAGCQLLFMPHVEEIYPKNYQPKRTFDFGNLDKLMEGAKRPGHFQGMAQVVSRLLDIVDPDQLFMGQKDFQQATIVQSMLEQMESSTQLVVCPIVREEDGLAMSSRNVRLTKEQRRLAPNIYRTLKAARDKTSTRSPKQIEDEALRMLAIPGMEPEYFRVVNGKTLMPIDRFDEVGFAVACTAVRLGEIRLIDNIILKNKPSR